MKYLNTILFLLFLGITIFLSINRHSKTNYNSYKSTIWADKAGYYVYLPAAIKYQFNSNEFPDSIVPMTGNGFIIDYEENKIKTKYTYGVSLLQLPFYLIADGIAKVADYNPNGFSPIYHWAINFAAVFYLFLGLFFLFKFLVKRYSNAQSQLILILLVLGSNLFYYSIDESGMSHVYSFCLISYFLYFIQKTHYFRNTKLTQKIALGLLIGLIILIRPTNIIILSAALFLDIKNKEQFKERIKVFINLKNLLLIVFFAFIVFIPQFIYWKYTFYSFINYSYGNETFNFLDSKLLLTWFSPNNGLFLYSPLYLFLFLSSIYFAIKKNANALYLTLLFIVISYLFSCWGDWTFGCSFGGRSFIEYLVLFSLILGETLKNISRQQKWKKIVFGFVMFLLVIYNLKLTYTFDDCFFGNGDWDWEEFKTILYTVR